jgi:hypothetical protein
MPPKAKGNSRNEGASHLEKESTAWTIIYASIVANQGIKP